MLAVSSHAFADKKKVTISEMPEWQRPVLAHVTFDAEVKETQELLGKSADPGDGFLVFSCKADQNLGKRILWITAEVTFSNGYKREFKQISF